MYRRYFHNPKSTLVRILQACLGFTALHRWVFLHIEGKSFPTIKIPTRFTAVIWNQTRDIRKVCLYLWRGLSIRSQSARRFSKQHIQSNTERCGSGCVSDRPRCALTIPLMHRPQAVVLNSPCSSFTALVV